MAATPTLACPACMWPMPPETWNVPGVKCPRCAARVEITTFPALNRSPSGQLPDPLQAQTEASCFYHARNRAAKACEACGRFLCMLCEIPIDSKILCPACFSAGVKANKIRDLDRKRTMYDSIALILATLPGLLVWPAVFGAPAALFFALRYWNAPPSLVPRTRARYYFAILFAFAELTGAGLVIWALTQIPTTPIPTVN